MNRGFRNTNNSNYGRHNIPRSNGFCQINKYNQYLELEVRVDSLEKEMQRLQLCTSYLQAIQKNQHYSAPRNHSYAQHSRFHVLRERKAPKYKNKTPMQTEEDMTEHNGPKLQQIAQQKDLDRENREKNGHGNEQQQLEEQTLEKDRDQQLEEKEIEEKLAPEKQCA